MCINTVSLPNVSLYGDYRYIVTSIISIICYCFYIRSKDFRVAFSHLGELRSIVPKGIPLIALTGTSTSEVSKVVCNKLSLDDPVTIGMSPNRDNLLNLCQVRICFVN